VEGPRRCRRNGTGNPALCGAHRDAIGASAAPAVSPFASILDSLFRGRPLQAGAVEGATIAAVERLIGRKLTNAELEQARTHGFAYFAAQRPPGSPPPPGQAPPPGYRNQEKAAAERARVIGRARKTLGFTAREHLDRDIIKARHRDLARKHHPDKGGSLERMQAINAAVATLLGSV